MKQAILFASHVALLHNFYAPDLTLTPNASLAHVRGA